MFNYNQGCTSRELVQRHINSHVLATIETGHMNKKMLEIFHCDLDRWVGRTKRGFINIFRKNMFDSISKLKKYYWIETEKIGYKRWFEQFPFVLKSTATYEDYSVFYAEKEGGRAPCSNPPSEACHRPCILNESFFVSEVWSNLSLVSLEHGSCQGMAR